jgi:putative DNA primase/helicase
MSSKELHKIDSTLKINPNVLATEIMKHHRIIYSAGVFYEYRSGYYQTITDEEIVKYIKNIVKDRFSNHLKTEVLASIKASVYIDNKLLNPGTKLTIQNGIFDIDTETIIPHTPDVYSTIQLSIKYDSTAICSKWIKTLGEIFEGDQTKIDILQEYFGLCLTRETKYCKALFLIGEGRNGKSTVLYVLENIIGEESRASMPMEALSNLHYVANLFAKLVNISVETNTKSEVCDATFKQIVSGDSIEADRKYGQPFTFRPYCKLIYALNNMPRVNDKTDAYFRRLIILRFNKQFSEGEDNKNLKNELLQELDGIFMWCIAGYKRLKAQTRFSENKDIQREIEEHKKENNNIIVFVEEACEIVAWNSIGKDDLYQAYKRWCQDNNHQALSKIRFGKELTRQYKLTDEFTGGREQRIRSWVGIDVKLITQKASYNEESYQK